MQRLPGHDYITIPKKPDRDSKKRPLIYPPDYVLTGDRETDQKAKKPYTRCTVFIDSIDDDWNLRQYDVRQTIRGLVVDDSLYLKGSGLGPMPDKIEARDAYLHWRDEMNGVGWDAKRAAKSDQKANIGDALHLFTERLDRGLQVKPNEVPVKYHGHLTNYMHATRELTVVELERFMVCDELKVGGTPDRLLGVKSRDQIVIGDVKTGNIDFNPEKIGRQLAVYSRSQIYDDATGRRSMPWPIDQDWGLIIHLDAYSGLVTLKWIDLNEAWEDVLLCRDVRKARNRRATMADYVAASEPVLPSREEITPTQIAAVITAIGNAKSEPDLYQIHTAAAHVWNDAMTDAANTRLAQLRGMLVGV